MMRRTYSLVIITSALVLGLTGCSGDSSTSGTTGDPSGGDNSSAVKAVMDTTAGSITVGEFFTKVDSANGVTTTYKDISFGGTDLVEVAFGDNDSQNYAGAAEFEVRNGKVTGGDQVSSDLLAGNLASAYAEWMEPEFENENYHNGRGSAPAFILNQGTSGSHAGLINGIPDLTHGASTPDSVSEESSAHASVSAGDGGGK